MQIYTPSSVIPDSSIVPAKLTQPFTASTAVSLSGTSVDFTNIPSWVKRITLSINQVSLSGTSDVLIQLGSSSGGIETTGYIGNVGVTDSTSPTYGAQTLNTGIRIIYGIPAAANVSGLLFLTNVSGNIWTYTGTGGANSTILRCGFCGGSKTLSSILDRVRITTVNGTDTFDLGSVNIFWE